ncbi:Nuclear localization sequence-binding protein [Mycena venus]|uniref:Nuclear localization sequence-binding protein n=1 Tax=Mycena venus TaxID=2733690 RepID=A0A8H7CCD0_9AGAR|nr:Nuclear localization sequence-binding protein [Mycena venus]
MRTRRCPLLHRRPTAPQPTQTIALTTRIPMRRCLMPPPPPSMAKEKPPDGDAAPTKKVKLANGDAAPASGGEGGEEEIKSIFVGKLSWNVDNDRLAQEFASCGEVVSATVAIDRNTGQSRGFGHVHFTTTEAVEAALKMNGTEIDGRPVNIDYGRPADKSKVRENRAKTFGDTASEPSATLFVGNLSFGVDEDTVWSFFNECGGSVKSVRLPTDRDTGRPKGFGYVEFEDIDSAKKAYEAANGQEIEGRAIRLDYSQPRDSSGGGGGGRGFGGGDRGGRGRGGFGGDRGGRGGGRGGFGDRGGRGGGRGRGGDRGGRGGRGAPRGGARTGGIVPSAGKKITFD